jgi:ornithine cyclodeaminase
MPNFNSSSLAFSVISGKSVFRILADDLQGCIDTVREAYLAHHHGRSVNPSSVSVRFRDKPNARINALPAHLGEPWRLSGIKWIASYPDNIHQGFPRASAVLILNDHDRGYPFACIESSIISAARTAASAVLAAAQLSPNGRQAANTLGIIGTGFIARYVYRFLIGTGWRIDAVRLFDIAPGEAERFGARVCDPAHHSSIRVVPDVSSAISESNLILFATVAAEPYVRDPALFKHRPVVLHISLRDLAPELLLETCNIVDDVDHVLQSDTSLHLAEKLTGGRGFITGTLSEVWEGDCGPDHSKAIIFSPFGLGVLDIAVGKWVYDRAVAKGEHLPVDGFFYDLQR